MQESTTTRADSSSTREQLLDTAERLFFAKGLDDVSLRAIVREAGQRNQSALQYHFGNREGLITAIVTRRTAQLEARRKLLLEAALADKSTLDLRDICTLLTTALFLLCSESVDFRRFLGHFAQRLLASEHQIMFFIESQDTPALDRVREHAQAALGHLPRPVRELRMENAYSLTLLAISRRARNGGTFRGARAELFLNNLIDQLVAMLDAPLSDATSQRLSDESTQAGHNGAA